MEKNWTLNDLEECEIHVLFDILSFDEKKVKKQEKEVFIDEIKW